MPIKLTMLSPSQYALKLPATNPDRMFSDAPPSREEVTTSRTCPESTDVNTFTNSGMMAPARVPHVMIVESFHHSVGLPPIFGISTRDTRYVIATETTEVSHTSRVSGASKFIFAALRYCAFEIASLSRYDTPLVTIIITRMTKIHTSSWTWTAGVRTATRIKEMSATPVTP